MENKCLHLTWAYGIHTWMPPKQIFNFFSKRRRVKFVNAFWNKGTRQKLLRGFFPFRGVPPPPPYPLKENHFAKKPLPERRVHPPPLTENCQNKFKKMGQKGLKFAIFGQALDKMCKKWQYLAKNDQKCRFWTKFGRFWAKNPNFNGSK